MNDDIKVETGSISGLLGEFQSQLSSLESLFGTIESETASAKGIWEGNASDTTLEAISQFNKVFDSIKEQNKVYAEFLKTVIEKYTDEDQSESNQMNSNSDYFDTSMRG